MLPCRRKITINNFRILYIDTDIMFPSIYSSYWPSYDIKQKTLLQIGKWLQMASLLMKYFHTSENLASSKSCKKRFSVSFLSVSHSRTTSDTSLLLINRGNVSQTVLSAYQTAQWQQQQPTTMTDAICRISTGSMSNLKDFLWWRNLTCIATENGFLKWFFLRFIWVGFLEVLLLVAW